VSGARGLSRGGEYDTDGLKRDLSTRWGREVPAAAANSRPGAQLGGEDRHLYPPASLLEEKGNRRGGVFPGEEGGHSHHHHHRGEGGGSTGLTLIRI
jgi:hypothetical protein